MRKTIAGISVALAGVLAAAPSWAAFLESPAPQAVVSGIGFISGWKCDAGNITVRVDGGAPIVVAMDIPREDTRASCNGVADNGFIQQINWEHVGEGEHEAVAYDDGVEFGRSTFTVGSTGEEFLQGVRRRTVVDGFPAPGERALLQWNESTQHFELLEVWGSELTEYNRSWWRRLNVDLVEGTYRTAEFLYDEEPEPDTCRAGRLTQAAKDRAFEAMRQIRGLHNLPPVRYNSHHDREVQAAALIHAAAGYPGHFPTPSAKCYTEEGARGSGTSNLWGVVGNIDPAYPMVLWTSDAGNSGLVAAVGHRRWILNPFARQVSYGQVQDAVALKVHTFDEGPILIPRVEVDYIAFPYEAYPFNLLRGDPPWSFSVIEDKNTPWGNFHPYFESAAVSVTRVADGTSLPVSELYTDTEGYGLPNLLSWQVAGWEFDTLYEVEISNVSMQSGETQSYSYPVFIDRANIEY